MVDLGLDEKFGEFVEQLSALEHEQWAHWTEYMLDNLTPENIERWRRQIKTPYEALSEKEKASDRERAVRSLEFCSAFYLNI